MKIFRRKWAEMSGTLNIMEPTARVTVIVAGTNSPSNAEYLADRFIEGLQSAGVQTDKMILRDLQIKHFTLERYAPHCSDKDDDFCKLEPLIADADGIVIATPIWNFSVPAHLKNLIDRMGAFALDTETRSKGQLKAKPFFIVYTGGAPKIAWEALMYLTTLHVTEAIKYYGGTVIGRHFEPKSIPGRGKFGLVVDKRPKTIEAMKRKGAKFGNIAKHYKENGTLPLRTRIGYQFFTFVYRVANRIMYPISTMQ
jgi:multimeric flavodoxin WrbA